MRGEVVIPKNVLGMGVRVGVGGVGDDGRYESYE